MIAIASSCHPKLIIADEPTTALDVTIQAQILQLLKRLKDETGTSILFITHDMDLARSYMAKTGFSPKNPVKIKFQTTNGWKAGFNGPDPFARNQSVFQSW